MRFFHLNLRKTMTVVFVVLAMLAGTTSVASAEVIVLPSGNTSDNVTEPTLLPEHASQYYRFQLSRLYRAYFDRVPDEGGLRYWSTIYSAGELNLNEISEYFATSPEFNALYGDVDNETFVELIYVNVLKRPNDEGGKNYWLGFLNNGTLTRGALMSYFAQSEEYINKNAAGLTQGCYLASDINESYRCAARKLTPLKEYRSHLIPSVGHEDTSPHLYSGCRYNFSIANCQVTSGNGPTVLMVGDSFSARMFPTILASAQARGWNLYYSVTEGCPWAINVSRLGHTACDESKIKTVQLVQALEPDLILLTNFPYEKHGESSRLSGLWPIQEWSDVSNVQTGVRLENESVFIGEVKNTLDWMVANSAPGAQVVVIEPAPVVSYRDTTDCAQAATEWDECDFNMLNYETDTQVALEAYAAGKSGVVFTSVNRLFCDGAQCGGVFQGHALLEDIIHMNSQVFLGEHAAIEKTFARSGVTAFQ